MIIFYKFILGAGMKRSADFKMLMYVYSFNFSLKNKSLI